MIGQASTQKAVQSHSGEPVAQSTAALRLRFIQTKYFTSTLGDTLAADIRAWFVDATENEQRELLDWRYRVDAGVHHVLILYSE